MARATVRFTDAARRDRRRILERTLREFGKTEAIRLSDRFKSARDQLNSHPDSGRLGRVHGTRELTIVGTPFISVYCTEGSCVTVIRILHGAQYWPSE